MTGAKINEIRPTPKQREAARIADTNLITLYGGAIRGGKTWWLILMLWTYALKYPKSRWVVVRESVPNLKMNTLVTFQRLLDEGLFVDLKAYNAQDRVATLNNGSQLIFMSESFDTDKELNRFRGLEINGAGIDEINEIQEQTFNKLIERAGSWQHSKGCPIKILATCNPTQGWVKKKFYDRWREQALPSGWAYVPAKITDNPHIEKEYIESLRMLPAFEYQCFVEGDWEAMPKTGGEFYKAFDYDKNTFRQAKIDGRPEAYDPNLPLHITFDFNVNPYMTCCVWQLVGKKARQIDEICLPSPRDTTKATCREFSTRYYGHTGGLFIYGDPAGRQEDTRTEKGYNDYVIIREELSGFRPTLRVANKAPNVVPRGNFLNVCFETGYQGISIQIGQNCVNTVNDYLYLKEDSDGTKKKEKVKDPATGISFEKYGHTSDANDYFLCYVFAGAFASYQKGGREFNIALGKNVSKNSY